MAQLNEKLRQNIRTHLKLDENIDVDVLVKSVQEVSKTEFVVTMKDGQFFLTTIPQATEG